MSLGGSIMLGLCKNLFLLYSFFSLPVVSITAEPVTILKSSLAKETHKTHSFLVRSNNLKLPLDKNFKMHFSEEFLKIPHSIGSVSKNKIKVAIIDTGVDLKHKTLADWDWGQSYDFVTNSDQIIDQHGHGTHVAGLITQAWPNEWKDRVQLLSLRYYTSFEPEKNLQRSKLALRWALDHQVDVINYSGGGATPDLEELSLLKEAEQRGVWVVTSSGNQGGLGQKFYPARYNLKNIIRVAAVDRNGKLADFSNFGIEQADVAALGVDVESAWPMNQKMSLSGTSQATALIASKLIRIILNEADFVSKESPNNDIYKKLLSSLHFAPQLRGKVKYARVM